MTGCQTERPAAQPPGGAFRRRGQRERARRQDSAPGQLADDGRRGRRAPAEQQHDARGAARPATPTSTPLSKRGAHADREHAHRAWTSPARTSRVRAGRRRGARPRSSSARRRGRGRPRPPRAARRARRAPADRRTRRRAAVPASTDRAARRPGRRTREEPVQRGSGLRGAGGMADGDRGREPAEQEPGRHGPGQAVEPVGAGCEHGDGGRHHQPAELPGAAAHQGEISGDDRPATAAATRRNRRLRPGRPSAGRPPGRDRVRGCPGRAPRRPRRTTSRRPRAAARRPAVPGRGRTMVSSRTAAAAAPRPQSGPA